MAIMAAATMVTPHVWHRKHFRPGLSPLARTAAKLLMVRSTLLRKMVPVQQIVGLYRES